MSRFLIKDIWKQKILLFIIIVSLIFIMSISNLVLLFFYNHLNLDRVHNQYYNIYVLHFSDSDFESTHSFYKSISEELKVKQECYSITGLINIEGKKLRAITFPVGASSKYFIGSNNFLPEVSEMITRSNLTLESNKWTCIDTSDFIVNGDVSIPVDCIISEQDFKNQIKEAECLSIEFSNHLNLLQIIKLKSLVKNYAFVDKLTYQTVFSESAFASMRNILIISLMIVVYIVITTLGLLQFFFKKQQKVIKVYSICGANRKILYIWYSGCVFLLDIIAWSISIPSSMLLFQNNYGKIEGNLFWLPYFISLLILVASSMLLIWKEIRKQSQEVIP